MHRKTILPSKLKAIKRAHENDHTKEQRMNRSRVLACNLMSDILSHYARANVEPGRKITEKQEAALAICNCRTS